MQANNEKRAGEQEDEAKPRGRKQKKENPALPPLYVAALSCGTFPHYCPPWEYSSLPVAREKRANRYEGAVNLISVLLGRIRFSLELASMICTELRSRTGFSRARLKGGNRYSSRDYVGVARSKRKLSAPSA